MVLLVDADSLIFAACYKKRENPDDDMFHDNIDEAIKKFHSSLMAIVNKLEDMYTIDKVKIFSGAKGNFRKLITKTYKANRSYDNRPPLLNALHKYVRNNYGSLVGYGVETDDMVAKYWLRYCNEIGRDNVMIVSIDKDYKQFPALIYNYHYKHKTILDISEDEAMYNFYEQMIVGDGADNVQYFKGKGPKFAQRYLADCLTPYQYTKKMYQLFIDCHKGKAKQRYIECYNLLKLRTD